jgi:hypothetical protein
MDSVITIWVSLQHKQKSKLCQQSALGIRTSPVNVVKQLQTQCSDCLTAVVIQARVFLCECYRYCVNSYRGDSRVNCLKTSDVSETHSVSILRKSDHFPRETPSLHPQVKWSLSLRMETECVSETSDVLNNWQGYQPEKSSHKFVAVTAWRHVSLSLSLVLQIWKHSFGGICCLKMSFTAQKFFRNATSDSLTLLLY